MDYRLQFLMDHARALRELFPEFTAAVRERAEHIAALRASVATIAEHEREHEARFKEHYLKTTGREWVGPLPKRGGEVRTPEPKDYPAPDPLAVAEYEKFLRDRVGIEDTSPYTQHLKTVDPLEATESNQANPYSALDPNVHERYHSSDGAP
jgi:hypothetical protein